MSGGAAGAAGGAVGPAGGAGNVAGGAGATGVAGGVPATQGQPQVSEAVPEVPKLLVDYCGEEYLLGPDDRFTIGREADLSVDDNPFLHRQFLSISYAMQLWWITNIGTHIAATVSETSGTMQAWLSPGARLPLVFPEMLIVFTAGSTTYEIELRIPTADYSVAPTAKWRHHDGDTTVGQVSLTESQKLLIVALAEPRLLRPGEGRIEVPPSAQAARRLGWTTTRFNRKLDNVCEKLDRIGVRGLRGGRDSYASNRRARLVEHAITSLLVTERDLELLDLEAAANGVTPRRTRL